MTPTITRRAVPESINADVADRLEEVAHLLQARDASVYRVDAYRRAAETVRGLSEPVSELFHREGLEGLDRLPGVGPVISRAIRDLVLTGVLPMLERMRSETDPARVFESVPGIGPRLAHRLREEFGIETLEELEMAAADGSLEQVPGFGAKRVRGVREALAGRLGRSRQQPAPTSGTQPPVPELLDVDREYREKAAAGRLRRIAPRRFNPHHEAWLPVLHTARGDRRYTALFSNTAQAHKLRRTGDWVVLYHDGANEDHQCTVVTETRGPLSGRRVVRGRERECADASRS